MTDPLLLNRKEAPRLEQVIADWRGDAAVLKSRGHTHDAKLLEDCAACGVVGYSENAHVAPPGEKGTGYKAGFKWIAPLCGLHPRKVSIYNIDISGDYLGCHYLYDEMRSVFRARFPSFDAEKACAETERKWQEASA